ncbi:MAG: DEAD/DEAH box helicase [Actinomycetota bacterium]|nr:DEAD/DEAH box helicase [Actinomycetota bacterium]
MTGPRKPDLYPHQRAELAFLLDTPRALLLSETGTGKTPVLLAYAEDCLRQGLTVLWVTEKGLVGQVMREAAVWLNDGTPSPVAFDKAKATDRFRVATHGLLARRAGKLNAFGADLLIVDEAQIVGGGGIEPNAATYRAIRELSEASTRSVFATATPVGTAHAFDLLALLECAQIPGCPSRAVMASQAEYQTATTKWGTAQVLAGITDYGLDLLIAALARHAIRTTVKDTGQAMPALVQRFIDVPLTGEDAQAYAEAGAMVGLRGHHYRQSASRSPDALVPALVHNMAVADSRGHRHVVVFTDNFDLFDPITETLRSCGRDVQTITGKDTPAQRTAALRAHAEAPASVLVGTGAVETGLNIQHASLLVSVVQSWNPAREEQREGRLIRLGSPHREVTHLVIRPAVGIEAHKVNRHDRKRDIAERVLGAVGSTAGERGAA